MKQILAQIAASALGPLYRRVPFPVGKRAVWNHILRRFVLWREIETEATTRFGARMHGNLADTIQSYIYFFGVWEPAITAYLTKCLGPGDIVIDVGANIGTHAAVFEAVHGSAPDIAGKGIANPLAMFLSAAMMLRHGLGRQAEAAALESAVDRALDEGLRTRDLGGNAGTAEATQAVLAHL